MANSEYPYTYACDLIRIIAGHDVNGRILSRSDACRIRKGFAEALGIDDETLAKKLADYFIENNDSFADKSLNDFVLKRYKNI